MAGDFSRLKIWAIHALSATPVLYFALALAGMRWWEYLLYFVHPGMMLGQLGRSPSIAAVNVQWNARLSWNPTALVACFTSTTTSTTCITCFPRCLVSHPPLFPRASRRSTTRQWRLLLPWLCRDRQALLAHLSLRPGPSALVGNVGQTSCASLRTN
jgi:hypothetical protein